MAWRTKAALFVSDHISSDFSIPVRQSSHSDASSALLSASRVNSSASILQVALLDSISSLQSLCHSESALSALESSVSGPSLLVRSFLRFASATFVSDLVRLEPSVPLKSFCVIDFTLFLAGAARMDFLSSLPVLDGAILEFSLLLQSLSHLDFPAPACYSSYLGPLLSIQSHACLDFSTFLGGSFIDFTSTVSDLASIGLPPLLHSSFKLDSSPLALGASRPGPPFLAPASATVDLSLLSRQLLCLDFPPLVLGLARFGSVFLLLVLEVAKLDASPTPRSLGRLDSVMLASGRAAPGSLLLPRGHACLGSLLFLGAASVDSLKLASSSPVSAACHLDPSLPVQSPQRAGSAALALAAMHPEPSPLLRSFAWPELLMTLLGAAKLEDSSPVLQYAVLDPSILPQSFSRPGVPWRHWEFVKRESMHFDLQDIS